MSDFTLAAMYWLNPKYTLDDFRREMRLVKENRFSMLRINIMWEYVEAEREKYDFSFYDLFFQAAEEAEIGVMATFVHYLPVHYLIEQQEKGNVDFHRRYQCLDRPEIRKWTERYFAATVCHYKDSPALKIWNIYNEPSDYPCRCPYSLEKFALWLKRKYPAIEDLQEAWSGEYAIFKPLMPSSIDEMDGGWIKKILDLPLKGQNTPMQLDWREFQIGNSAEHMAYLASLVHRYDTKHALHSNPCVTVYNPLYSGISPWQMAKSLDSFSGSIHPHGMLASLESNPDKYPCALLSIIDLIRSWSDGKEAWIGEYQAGSTFFKVNAYTPRGTDISAMLYHSLARGMKGLVFWEWQSWRSGVFEPGEFSLRNPSDGGPTERSDAARKFGEFVEKYQECLAKLSLPEPQVAIFHSMDEFAMEELLQSTYPNVPPFLHYNAAYATHQVLAKAGISADFVTESQFASGVLKKYKVLIMPQVRMIAKDTANAIKEYVHNGGTVWADGRCGVFDKHLYLRNIVPCNGLDELFGCREMDEVAPREDDMLVLKNGLLLKPCREMQRLDVYGGARVLAECNGFPAAVGNHYGNGTAELWGTYLTANPNAELAEILPRFVIENGVEPELRICSVCVAASGRRQHNPRNKPCVIEEEVIFSLLSGQDTLLAVFTSLASHEQKVTAQLPVSKCRILNDATAVFKDGCVEFSLRPRETLPLLLQIEN